MNHFAKKLLVLIILFVLIGWPIYQLYGLVKGKSEQRDAAELLFQVSLFQVELLNSLLKEASTAVNTMQLDPLKQSVYTVNYTHEHLILAFPDEELNPLRSVNEMMQYILRLQLGGQRGLRPEEVKVFLEVSKAFEALFRTYQQLVTPKGKLDTSKSKQLQQIDREIAAFLKKRLLE